MKSAPTVDFTLVVSGKSELKCRLGTVETLRWSTHLRYLSAIREYQSDPAKHFCAFGWDSKASLRRKDGRNALTQYVESSLEMSFQCNCSFSSWTKRSSGRLADTRRLYSFGGVRENGNSPYKQRWSMVQRCSMITLEDIVVLNKRIHCLLLWYHCGWDGVCCLSAQLSGGNLYPQAAGCSTNKASKLIPQILL